MRPARPILLGALFVAWTVPTATLADGVAATNPATTQEPVEAADPAKAAVPPGALPWAEVCKIVKDEDLLLVETSLTMETLRNLDSTVEVYGLPGETYLTITSRRFDLENTRREGNEDVTIVVSGARGGFSIELTRERGTTSSSVTFTQGNPDYRRGGQSDDVRLVCYNVGPDRITLSAYAENFQALRRKEPKLVNRYLRPVLAMLKSDVMELNPLEARQVLLSEPADLVEAKAEDSAKALASVAEETGEDAKPVKARLRPVVELLSETTGLTEAVRDALKTEMPRLNDGSFSHREGAERRLATLGPPLIRAFAQLDRAALSAQQNLVIDRLRVAMAPLSAEEVRERQQDVHYLLDCLYCDDVAIRDLAIDRLASLTGKSQESLRSAVKASRDADGHSAAIEKLRDDLTAPPSTKPTSK